MISQLISMMILAASAQQPAPKPLDLPMSVPSPPPAPVQTVKPVPYEQLNAFGTGSGSNQALLVLHGVLSRLPSKDGSQTYTLVNWNSLRVNVVEKAGEDGKYTFETELVGKADPKRTLIINYRPVKLEADGSFKFKLVVTKAITELQLNLIQSDGKLLADPYALTVTDWNLTQGRENIAKKEDPKKFFFAPGLGVTSFNYTQTNTDVGTLTPIMVTLKLGADYRIQKKNWVLGFVGFMNILPISGSTATTDFKFIGLNLRAGKKLDWLSPPWELTLSAGLYYLTMITSGNFGFSNVAGPQLYPTIRYSFNNGSALLSYVKFSPISQGFTLMSFTNFELATGVHYQFPRLKKIGYSVGIDVSSVALTTLDQNNVSGTVASRTISLGVTASF